MERVLQSFPVLANTGIPESSASPGEVEVFPGSTRGGSRGEESEEGGKGYLLEEGPPTLFDIKIGPRHPKFSPWISLGYSRWSFGALFVRLGML